MKNMFIVINKEKIYAYVVSILTIVTLFFVTGILNTKMDDTKAVYSNAIQENNYNIENNCIEENINN